MTSSCIKSLSGVVVSVVVSQLSRRNGPLARVCSVGASLMANVHGGHKGNTWDSWALVMGI